MARGPFARTRSKVAEPHHKNKSADRGQKLQTPHLQKKPRNFLIFTATNFSNEGLPPGENGPNLTPSRQPLVSTRFRSVHSAVLRSQMFARRAVPRVPVSDGNQ